MSNLLNVANMVGQISVLFDLNVFDRQQDPFNKNVYEMAGVSDYFAQILCTRNLTVFFFFIYIFVQYEREEEHKGGEEEKKPCASYFQPYDFVIIA